MNDLMSRVAGGDPSRMQTEVDILRGAREGRPNPELAKALPTPVEQAQADRYAWGADIARQTGANPSANPILKMAGMAALAPPVAYEGVKAAAPSILPYIGKFLPQGEEMQVNNRTSPASMDNIRALIAGYQNYGNRR
jgi:hypothetical protein